MDVYFGHPSCIEFREEIYEPIRRSELYTQHNIVLPHEDSDEPFDSKEFLREECDLMISEVSAASTGLGIELGWADSFDVRVVYIHRDGASPSSSVPVVGDKIGTYGNREELVNVMQEAISA